MNNFIKQLGLEPSEVEFIEEVNMIRSRFYIGFVYHIIEGSKMHEQLRKGIAYRREAYNKAVKEGEYAKAMFIIERPYRFSEFLDLYREIEENKSKKYAGNLCAEIWVDSENPGINIGVWKGLFKRYGKLLMDKDDLEVWNKLPEEFEVWHGDEGLHDGRISWTLERDVAVFFAKRFTDNQRLIESKMVKKKDCLCYFGSRNEEEIIIL